MKKNHNGNLAIKIFTIILSVYWVFFISVFLIRFAERKFFYPVKYYETVLYYSKEYGIDKYLVFSVIKVESNFKENAESDKGAMGLMQITQSTASFIANKIKLEEYDLKNSQDNINLGCFYLRYLIDKFQNTETAIIAYNAGEGNVLNWLNSPDFSRDKKTLFFVPYSESSAYLVKVKKTFKKYENLYRYIVDK